MWLQATVIAGKAAHYTLLAALPMALHGFGTVWPAMAAYIATQVCSGDLPADLGTLRLHDGINCSTDGTWSQRRCLTVCQPVSRPSHSEGATGCTSRRSNTLSCADGERCTLQIEGESVCFLSALRSGVDLSRHPEGPRQLLHPDAFDEIGTGRRAGGDLRGFAQRGGGEAAGGRQPGDGVSV